MQQNSFLFRKLLHHHEVLTALTPEWKRPRHCGILTLPLSPHTAHGRRSHGSCRSGCHSDHHSRLSCHSRHPAERHNHACRSPSAARNPGHHNRNHADHRSRCDARSLGNPCCSSRHGGHSCHGHSRHGGHNHLFCRNHCGDRRSQHHPGEEEV